MDNEWMMRWWWISCDERNSISGSHRTIKSTSLLAGCPYPLLYLTSSSPSMLLLWFGPRMWMSTCYAKLKCRSTHQHKALSIFPLKSSHSSCKRIWISIRQLRWPHNNTNVLAALFAWLQAIRTAEFISIEENSCKHEERQNSQLLGHMRMIRGDWDDAGVNRDFYQFHSFNVLLTFYNVQLLLKRSLLWIPLWVFLLPFV